MLTRFHQRLTSEGRLDEMVVLLRWYPTGPKSHDVVACAVPVKAFMHDAEANGFAQALEQLSHPPDAGCCWVVGLRFEVPEGQTYEGLAEVYVNQFGLEDLEGVHEARTKAMLGKFGPWLLGGRGFGKGRGLPS